VNAIGSGVYATYVHVMEQGWEEVGVQETSQHGENIAMIKCLRSGCGICCSEEEWEWK